MIPMNNHTKVYSGNANPELSKEIVDLLGIELSPVELTKFSDGEIRCEILQHVRSHHTFIIQPTCAPVNDNLMELAILTDALRRQNVKDITAVVPYWGYARQDRKPGFTRTPITSRLVADIIQTTGVTQLVTVDIHSGQQLGFFKIPVINISAAPGIVAHIWRNCDLNNVIIVSPDTGGVVRARAIAKELPDVDLAIIDKRRPDANRSEVMNVIGDVEGMHCVIVDDMIDTAGTLCKGALALKERGALKVSAYATHPVFSGNAIDNIEQSVLDEVIVSNTIPLDPLIQSDKIKVLSIAEVIAETMRRIRSQESISELYIGH